MNPADHALAALLWSETTPDGNPLDHLPLSPSPLLIQRVRSDWQRFRDKAEDLGFDAEAHCVQMLHPDCEGDAWNAAAHDFILTRNHHGTGFWDYGRWAEPWGDQLTTLCRSFGCLEVYVADDGMIYPEEY